MSRLLAVLLFLHGPATAPAPANPSGPQERAAVLLEARVTIEMRAGSARISARYRLAGAEAPATLRALRLPGQELALEAPAGAAGGEGAAGGAGGAGCAGGPGGPGAPPGPAGPDGPPLERLPGMYRATAAWAAGSPGRVDLRYAVTGALDRVPLFVPEAPAVPGRTAIEIQIRGLPGTLPARGAFPRLARAADGALVARPDNLPTFVWLPSPLGRRLERAADAGALLLILAGTGGWLALRGRAGRRGGRRAHRRGAVRAGDGGEPERSRRPGADRGPESLR